jgi:hypothetical protein
MVILYVCGGVLFGTVLGICATALFVGRSKSRSIDICKLEHLPDDGKPFTIINHNAGPVMVIWHGNGYGVCYLSQKEYQKLLMMWPAGYEQMTTEKDALVLPLAALPGM